MCAYLDIYLPYEQEFGEILNVISGSSTSLRYTKQLNLKGYIGSNINGRVVQIMGNLHFELAMLGTYLISLVNHSGSSNSFSSCLFSRPGNDSALFPDTPTPSVILESMTGKKSLNKL